MKLKLIMLASIVVLAFFLAAFRNKYEHEKSEKDKYCNNMYTILDSLERFRVNDSLNAINTSIIKLKLSEYEDLKREDAKLINELLTKNKKLNSVISAQTSTINKLNGSVKDSLIYVDRVIVDSLKCISYNDEWLNVDLCLTTDNTYSGAVTNYESLKVVRSAKYKRFLGFLWYTNKIKSEHISVISLNPSTEIRDVEYIQIE